MTRFTKTIAAFATAATLGLAIASSSSTPAAACGGGGWGGGFHHHWGPGLGVALGALGAAGAYAYGGGCYVTREAVRDVYGNVLYSRPVRVCD
jgi:hypothetical protein